MRKLDTRLALVMSMVPVGAKVCDVGTDHAFLPIHLIQTGKCPSVIASDLRPGPLKSAEKNVAAAGLQERIILRLSDGLDQIAPDETNCIIMAGMGGILITQIIARTAWVRDTSQHLILQPMTDADVVREFLCLHGFSIIEERAATAGRHVYTAMHVIYDGHPPLHDALFFHVGLLPQGGKEEHRWLVKEAKRLRTRSNGLIQSGRQTDEAAHLANIAGQIEAILHDMEGKI